MEQDWVAERCFSRPLRPYEIDRNLRGNNVQQELTRQTTQAQADCPSRSCSVNGELRIVSRDGEPTPEVHIWCSEETCTRRALLRVVGGFESDNARPF
ncbi:MAG: hypothetical protein WBO35_00375 [Candidatus Saccharimonadales bacterium]